MTNYAEEANPELEQDPPTALWRTLPNHERQEGPLRSDLAHAYRKQLGQDWRDYYAGPYVDDGPNQWEDHDA